jgi:hypothetical protein
LQLLYIKRLRKLILERSEPETGRAVIYHAKNIIRLTCVFAQASDLCGVRLQVGLLTVRLPVY